MTMDRRVELFFAELQRWTGQTNEKGRKEVNVHLQASVQWTLGCARLQCAVTFYDFAKDGVAEVTGSSEPRHGHRRGRELAISSRWYNCILVCYD